MDAPSARQFVRVLAPALRQAAGIARALEGRVGNRPKSGELSDVKAALTIADSAAQEALLVPLLEHFGNVALLAEEDTPSVAHFPTEGDPLVVIDPIDGTLRFYLEGQGPYAIMAGLAVGGRYVAALVALPREGLVFDAVRGGPAHRAGAGRRPLRVRAEATGTRVLVSADMPEAVSERLRERGFEVVAAAGGALAVAPLIPGVRAGLRLASQAEGVSIRGRIGALISSCAGALVERETRVPFPDALDEPARALVVAATRADLDALHWALSAANA